LHKNIIFDYTYRWLNYIQSLILLEGVDMKRTLYLLISLFVIAGLALAGCQKTEEPVVEEPEVEEPEVEEPVVEEPEVEEPVVEEPEEAALGTEENPLIWALVPSGETEDVLAGFDAVTDIIYEETGLVIESFVATEYVGVIEALAADPPKAHIASLATFAYIVAAERGVAEAELVAVRYGAPYYTGQIFVRTDSGITDISELAGTTFCRPDPYSTSGWVIPSITLRSIGIDPDADLDVVDAGSHDASVIGVYNGDCVAGSSFVDARASVSDEYPDVMEVLTVINESVEIPNDGVQYHPSVSREIRDLINGVLLRIDEIEGAVEALEQAYEWTELAEFGDDFYDPFRDVLSAAGVNIEDYLGD
jgi:phosphonate transport system substrate-binding protein